MKRTVSVLLTIIMILSVIVVAPFTVNGASCVKTQSESIAWLNAQEGARYNLDNAWGSQCSDFASAYINYVLYDNPTSGGFNVYDAKDYSNKNLYPSDWEVFENDIAFVPQPGDIFITKGNTSHGHIGVVIASTENYATIVDQNGMGDWSLEYGSPAHIHNITWTSSGIWCPTYFIRPKFSDGFVNNDTSAPTDAWLSISKNHYDIGETITFNFGATGATYYIIGINLNGSRIITETILSGKSYTFNESGDYTAHVTCCNSLGYIDTNTVSFAVVSTPPINPWLSISKDHYSSGEEVTFTFDATYADYYIIGINKDGVRIITETITSGKSYTFYEQGDYTAHITCCNSFGYSDTNEVSFVVFSTSPIEPWIAVSKNQFLVGELVIFNFGATNAQYYFIGIEREGDRIITELVSPGSSYSFDQPGKYTAYVSCCNTFGYIDSEKITFMIYSTEDFGDANGDGEVNIQDATLVQMFVAKYKVDNFNEKLADCDQSGAVNIQDATAIQMKVVKLA